MANPNTTPVPIRTQVYLNDPDYFCNKSWTMSYNLNTKTWISYHSYIPNFYIGENNFFYSGLNGCCDDINNSGFEIVAGVVNKSPQLTTTTTTFYPSPTTTSTTTVLDCTLIGEGITTSCDLEGNAIITVPPTTTTTICQRPYNLLTQFTFIRGYTLATDPKVVFIDTLTDACDALAPLDYITSVSNTDGSTLDTFPGFANTTTTELQVGNIVYYGQGVSCEFVPDGWYYVTFPIPYVDVYHIVGGIINEITTCDCNTTTTTTTTLPLLTECCGILLSSNDTINYLDKTTNVISQLTVPGYVASTGIAMTVDKFWSIDTDIQEWDIVLNPFAAISNRTISLPGGFTTSSGIVALNDTTLIGINDTASPQEVTELDITTLSASGTIKFTLQTDRAANSNPLYTQTGQIIIINRDTVSSDYYISQYNYYTGNLELDINIGSVEGVTLFECDCNIYVTDAFGHLYAIIKTPPYVLLDLGYSLTLSPIYSATQIGTCVVSPIVQDITTTTTTTIVPTTTTTTTLP
jgi:hypothetical protein